MASRFWVGGGSANTWAATASTNWAATSGGANNQTVPTTTDVAIFDSNSGVGNSVISANITVQKLECDGSTLGTGAYGGTLTHNGSVTLSLNTAGANTLRFSSGMTYTPAAVTSIVALTHTTGTANIKSNGKAFAALTINGVGGTTQTLDATSVNAVANSVLTLTNGIIDFNGGAGGPYALTTCLLSASNSNTRSLILGGTVTLGGNVSNNTVVWTTTTTTGLTFTKNSANIIILAPSSAIASLTFAAGALTFNNLTLNALTSNTQLGIGNSSWSNFTVNAGWALAISTGATITVTNPFTWTGTSANPILVYPAAVNGAATFSCASGACSLTWGGLIQTTGSGGATFTATNSFNFGSNTGWTITPPSGSAGGTSMARIQAGF